MEQKVNENNLKSFWEQRTCPKCKSDWKGDSILETFIKQREDGIQRWQGKTDEQIEKEMKIFYPPPYYWGREIIIEITFTHKHYDGASYLECPDCETTFNRFTGFEEKIR